MEERVDVWLGRVMSDSPSLCVDDGEGGSSSKGREREVDMGGMTWRWALIRALFENEESERDIHPIAKTA